MCQCDPMIKSPWCGKPGCQPPQQAKPETARVLSDKPALGTTFLIGGRKCVAIPVEPTPEEQKRYTDWMGHMHMPFGEMAAAYGGLVFAAMGTSLEETLEGLGDE